MREVAQSLVVLSRRRSGNFQHHHVLYSTTSSLRLDTLISFSLESFPLPSSWWRFPDYEAQTDTGHRPHHAILDVLGADESDCIPRCICPCSSMCRESSSYYVYGHFTDEIMYSNNASFRIYPHQHVKRLATPRAYVQISDSKTSPRPASSMLAACQKYSQSGGFKPMRATHPCGPKRHS